MKKKESREDRRRGEKKNRIEEERDRPHQISANNQHATQQLPSCRTKNRGGRLRSIKIVFKIRNRKVTRRRI